MESCPLSGQSYLQVLGAQLAVRLWIPRYHSEVVKPAAPYPHNLQSCLNIWACLQGTKHMQDGAALATQMTFIHI